MNLPFFVMRFQTTLMEDVYRHYECYIICLEFQIKYKLFLNKIIPFLFLTHFFTTAWTPYTLYYSDSFVYFSHFANTALKSSGKSESNCIHFLVLGCSNQWIWHVVPVAA